MYVATENNIYQVRKMRGHGGYRIYRLVLDGRKIYESFLFADTAENATNKYFKEGTWKKIDLRTIIKIKEGEK